MRIHKFGACFLATSLFSATAIAESLDSHVHGEGELTMVVEGQTVQVTLSSPAANIVGFEHEAKSEQDKKVVSSAIAQFNDGYKMVTLPESALCLYDNNVVEQTLMKVSEAKGAHNHEEHKDDHGHHDEHEHEKEHDHHDHEKEHAHHDEHDHEKGHDHHDNHDGHDHSESSHADFKVTYNFRCMNPEGINKVSFGFFKAFPATEKLEFSWVTAAGQGHKELTASKSSVEF